MFLELHVDKLIVKNMDTGKEHEFDSYQEAEDFLIDIRNDGRPTDTWKLLAVVDA